MRPIVWAEAAATIGDAARLLDGDDHSCVLVRLPEGLGIATDHDFRRSLADAALARESPIGAICSAPIATVTEDTEASTAFLEMIERGIHHLVVTTDLGDPVGVVRVVDLASAEVRDPLLVRRAVQVAKTMQDLREASSMLPRTAVELAEIGTPALQVVGLLSAVRDVIVRRVVELARVDGRPADPSWLVLGSLARREALPHSDVDTAMVWPTASSDRSDQLLEDAEVVLTAVEYCGLSRCPDGANATEPLFARSVDGWSEATALWTRHPESSSAMLLASIVADNRPLTNVELGRALTQSMLSSARDRSFLDALLHFTLAVKPQRRLIGGLAVDRSGPHRGQLDLKRGGLWPAVLLGRWMGLVVGDARGSTVDRIRRGAAAGLLTPGEAEDLIAAFEQIFQLRFERGITALKSGDSDDSHVDPRALDPLQRRYLDDSLRAIAETQNAVRSAWAGSSRRSQ
jgi:CBS domain-containing protein